MTVNVDYENHPLSKARFAMPSAPHRRHDNPLQAPAAAFISELQRVGWSAEGITTDISTIGGGSNIVRYVSSVQVDSDIGRIRIGFSNFTDRFEEYAASSIIVDDGPETSFWGDGSGRGQDSRTSQAAVRTIEQLTDKLRSLPDAAGHDDVTQEGDLNMRNILHVEPIQAPENMPTLYTFVHPNDAYRLAGFDDTDDDRGMDSGGARLLHLGVRGDYPRFFNRGFVYASFSPETRAGHSVHSGLSDTFPAALNLQNLTEVYVVDNSRFEEARRRYWDAVPEDLKEDHRVKDADVDKWLLATACTAVPYSDYKGDFQKPVVIIGRRIEANEIRLVSGPITVNKNQDGLELRISDEVSGTSVLAERQNGTQLFRMRQICRLADNLNDLLRTGVTADEEITGTLKREPEPDLAAVLGR